MSRKTWAGIGFFVVVIVAPCLYAGVFTPSSARRSDSAIRDELLTYTPVGTEGDQVREQVNKRFPAAWVLHNFTKDGWANKSIHAKYGVYQTWSYFPWATVVDVVWAFDDQGKLKYLSVSRYVDSI